MRIIRHPEVPQELEAGALWYEERQSGLGVDFIEAVMHPRRRPFYWQHR